MVKKGGEAVFTFYPLGVSVKTGVSSMNIKRVNSPYVSWRRAIPDYRKPTTIVLNVHVLKELIVNMEGAISITFQDDKTAATIKELNTEDFSILNTLTKPEEEEA